MRRGQRVSLCAKWCPLLYHSFDRRTLLCESIARWLFPSSLPQFAGCTERQYAYRARDQLRKELSQLGEYMKLPERLMCQQRWNEIRYKALPAACLTKNAKSFEKHDPIRFQEFMDKVRGGKVQVNTGALQPHEILKRAVGNGTDSEKELAQGQWCALLERAREAAQLEDCIAVCDVSGSMSCPAAPGVSCMDVAISLSLVVAHLASGDLARQVITFHESPELVKLPDTTNLAELHSFMMRLSWGGSTNFHRVFELLKRAEKPPKKVIVFSDMQFASAGGKAPVLRQVQESYRKLGLRMPELVFWNLRGTSGAPALATDAGVVLMSGFSSRMLEMLMGSGSDPLAAFAKALENPLCRKVRVIHDLNEANALVNLRPATHNFEAEEAAVARPDGRGLRERRERQGRSERREPRTVSANLAALPCRQAEAALIGKGGKNMQTLRQTLQDCLCNVLEAGRFRFWLDLRQQMLVATVEAAEGSFPEGQMKAALDDLKQHIPRRVVYNKVSHALELGLPRLPEWQQASMELAELPSRWAIAEFIGCRGRNIVTFQEKLRSRVDGYLGTRPFTFRVDVQSTPFAGGTVSATLEACSASLTARQLQAALAKLRCYVRQSQSFLAACRVGEDGCPDPAVDSGINAAAFAAKDRRGESARTKALFARAKHMRANAAAIAKKERALYKFRRAARAKAAGALRLSRRAALRMMAKMHSTGAARLFQDSSPC